MVSEVRQRKINTMWSHTYVESKNKQRSKQQKKTELDEGDQKVQTFSYKIHKSWDVMYNIVNTVLYIQKLLRVDLKSFHHRKKKL